MGEVLPGIAAMGKPKATVLPGIEKLAFIKPGEGSMSGVLQPYQFDEFGFQPKLGQDNYKIRAQAQGWGEQLAKTIGNLVPNIATGILEGIGYLGELFDPAQDYDNGLIRTMQSWRNPFGEVYRENPEEVFDLGDPAWWFNNVGQLTESAAEFALPGAVFGKAFSTVAKGAKALTAGSRFANGIAVGADLAAQGATAATLAYMEGAMSGNQVYKEIYQQQYTQLKNRGVDPLEAEQTARELAAKGAAATVRLNTLINTAMNFVSLEPFFHNGENKIRSWVNTEGKRLQGESIADWKKRIASAAEQNPELKKILAGPSKWMYVPGMISEGVEEVNTQYAEETGREVGGIRAKKNLDTISDYFDKIGNQEGLLNFALGVFGGIAQTAILQSVPVHAIERIGADGKPILKPGSETAFETRRVSARTRDAFQRARYYDSIKEAMVADIDWYSQKSADLEKAVAAGKPLEAQKIRNEMLGAHNLNAVMLGNASNWISEYERIGATDNTKDLGEPIAAQIQELSAQIEQDKKQGADTSQAEAQVEELRKQYDKVKGKTQAMLKGLAYDRNDNEYKKRAQQAAEDVKWMDKTHAELREKYLDETNPHSEEMVNHIFARTVSQHITKRLMDAEEQQLNKDELLMGSINRHTATIEVANLVAKDLNTDIENLKKATDKKEIERLLSKYKVAVNSDADIQSKIKELVDVLSRRKQAHKDVVDQATAQLHRDSGYDAWKENNKGSFDDYLKYIGETSPVDTDFIGRKVELAKTKIEYELGETSLAEVKSKRGRDAFTKAAQKDKSEWTRREEQRRVQATAAVLERKFGKETAAKLTRAKVQSQLDDVKRKIEALKKERNELSKKFTENNTRKEQINAKPFFKSLKDKIVTVAELTKQNAEIDNRLEVIKTTIERLEVQKQQLEDKLQELIQAEEDAKNVTIDELKDEPATNPVVAETPEVTPESAPVVKPVEVDTSAIAATTYAELVDMVSGEVRDMLDNIEMLQKLRMENGERYSYDLAKKGLQDAVNSQLISEDTMHKAIMWQKEYLESTVQKNASVAPVVEETISTDMEKEIEQKARGLESASKGDKGIFWTQFKGVRQDYEKDQEVEIEAVSKHGVKFKGDSKWRNFEPYYYFKNLTKEQEIRDRYEVEAAAAAKATAVDANDLENMSEPMIPVIDGALDMETFAQDQIAEHVTEKTATSSKVNTASIEYREIAPGTEVWDEEGQRMVKMTKYKFLPEYDKLDPNANHNILRPNFVQPGDELEFRVDTEFSGQVNFDQMLVNDEYGKPQKRAESFADHVDVNGKIIMNEEGDGFYNVPIAIYHKRTGEKIGYLPRTDWVTAKYENSVNYRNMRNVLTDAFGNVISSDNVRVQKEKLVAMRRNIAAAFNEGNGQVYSAPVTIVNPGHIFYNTTMNYDSEWMKYKNQQAKNVLPDTSLELVIINNGTAFKGSKVPYDGPANFNETTIRRQFGSSRNQPAVLLPMPNGAKSLSPLETVTLENRAADTFTIARAIEAYVAFHENKATAFHEKLIGKIREVTSQGGTGRPLDITNEKDLELFINQYFTYTQWFKDYHTQADRPAGTNEKKEPRFKLAIGKRTGTGRADIKIGTTFSGVAPMYAKIGDDGSLDTDFEEALIQGLGTHRKAIVFTNGELRGINHPKEFQSITVTKRKDSDGNWVIATKKHANYNEYVKSFTTSHVYGKHRIGSDGKPDPNGRYVYGANPVIEFYHEAIINTPVLKKASAADLAAVLQGEQQVTGDPFLGQEDSVFGELLGADPLMSYTGTIEGAVEASIENLTKLQQSTPADQRNSKSPEQVQAEMHSNGIDQIAPGFNPFLKC